MLVCLWKEHACLICLDGVMLVMAEEVCGDYIFYPFAVLAPGLIRKLVYTDNCLLI